MSDRVSLPVSDFMTRGVLSVESETPVSRIAQFLVDHAISAVPVVEDGVPVGMVSESDLVARRTSPGPKGGGWLSALLRTGPDSRHAFAELFRSDMTARDVMSSPVISVSEHATLAVALETMVTRNVKRLPVLSQGRICGIISRADLLKAIARSHAATPTSSQPATRLAHGSDHAGIHPTGMHSAETAHNEPETVISAVVFREAAESYKLRQAEVDAVAKRHVREDEARQIESLLEQPLTDGMWREMLLRARSAANRGSVEIELLRFPCGLCEDGGRMINNAETGWPSTLRGLPAEIWRRWDEELHPKGFRLTARVIDFPDGMPGHVGFFLSWKKW
jgi:CBS domain-containing protein